MSDPKAFFTSWVPSGVHVSLCPLPAIDLWKDNTKTDEDEQQLIVKYDGIKNKKQTFYHLQGSYWCSSIKGEQHVKSNFQAQLRHNRQYLGYKLEKYKFESKRHTTVVDKDSQIFW